MVMHFKGHYIVTASERQRWVSMYITLFTVLIHVYSTIKFRESFEATAYISVECLHVNNFLCLNFMQLRIWRILLKYFRDALSVRKQRRLST